MPNYTLLLLEATGIQHYIFGSNNLAQNIGASECVTQATTLWVFETLDKLKLPHNVPRVRGEYVLDDEIGTYRIGDASISHDSLAVEVVYAGGGNALLLFADPDKAKLFVKELTLRLLLEAPGLEIAVVSRPIDWKDAKFQIEFEHLRRALGWRKVDRPLSAPLSGLGVTAACAFTGLPAVGMDDERPSPHLISSVVEGKLDAEDAGLERLHAVLPAARRNGFGFVYDFDLFGSKGESSYIAVVHADGNNMGERKNNVLAKSKDSDACVRALRAFSKSVNKAATTALRATLDALIASRDGKGKFGGVVPMPSPKSGLPQLPFRPIVFGGDDVTFVCDGRLGLTLAVKYLSELARQTLSDEQPAYARAGVAVCKSHFPFSRTYDLAENLCASAKTYINRWKHQHKDGDLVALDWHFAVSGLVHDLDEIRWREYTVKDLGNLYMRPYRLTDPAGDPAHSWDSFSKVTDEFKREDGNWADKRNKVIRLREVLRCGPEMTEQFLRSYGLGELPEVPGRPKMQMRGWDVDGADGMECGYFDAIEAMEFVVPLRGGTSP
jgi:hypothetical protein